MAYLEILKEQAREDYRIALLGWSINGGKKPQLPPLLKD